MFKNIVIIINKGLLILLNAALSIELSIECNLSPSNSESSYTEIRQRTLPNRDQNWQ